ncbi:hypothetical protein [Lewinella sp. IMCC34191]|uniref:hypothetical protein n=1 Tax=Lewinella sp. IMCC34191 TaxID=2259172 RepID=UPI000E239720|nr:hypothetical protein [Lewinella sp. IMCC34191]
MLKRKIVAALLLVLALWLGIDALGHIRFPVGLEGYFQPAYYRQFGPLALCVELFIAGGYLFVRHRKANFALALFGFTVILEIVKNLLGGYAGGALLFPSVLIGAAGIAALWMAFSNVFSIGRISFLAALGSFVLGTVIESFFTSLYI